MSPELEEEIYNPKNWEHNMKSRCALCGEALFKSKRDYLIRGNYCSFCDQYCNEQYKMKTKEERMKDRKFFVELFGY